MKKFLALITLALLLAGCKGTKALLPNVSGKAGEIVVVMDKPYWEGGLGNDVRGLLASDCPYLAQKEPLYSLVNVVPSQFGDIFKIHRNIVIMNINPQVDSSSIVFRHDVWSQPQCVIQISAADTTGAAAVLKQRSSLILASIEQAERDRVIHNTMQYEEKDIAPKVKEIFGGSLHFPVGYKIRKATNDFMWIAYDTQYVYQDAFIYRYPVDKDNPFSEENIIMHRNEVLEANVPGMFDNTFMTTSQMFPVTIESLKYKDRRFVQTRGLWEVKNDFMGGPFVSHSFYSQDGKYIIVLEAWIYAPRFDKRQYLRQAESILYTWEWGEKGAN